MDIYIIISLSVYFLLMLGIGAYYYRLADTSVEGFLLGGRSVSPGVTALSAGASDMSGWILMGLPGAMYISGLSSAWIAIGLFIGAVYNYRLIAPRLRVYTEECNALTIPDYFAHRFEDTSHTLRITSALVIILFFTLYTSSGISAGGKLFESAFGLDYSTGLLVTSGVVVAYTMFGGFMAVSITDFVQGCIMFVALILVPVVAMSHIGGISPTLELIEQVGQMKQIDYLSLFGGAGFLAIVSSMAWGLGYFGQPHIIVRFMAIRSVHDLPVARKIGLSWIAITMIGALLTGLTGVAYVQQQQMTLADPETIFIVYSQILFHPLITGFLLAAILAAIMSTISSQLLVTSSSLAGDLYNRFLRRNASDKELLLISRASVALVAVVAVMLAWDGNSSILSLVSNAWAGFGAAFGPVILISLIWANMTRLAAIAGMLTGALVVLLWINAPFTIAGSAPNALLYEIVPGFLAATVVIIVVSRFTPSPSNMILQRHETVQKKLDN